MGCNKCGRSSCNCTPCSGVPFYAQADTCQEDHCERIYQPQFSFAVCPTVSWNIPLCGQTALLSVPGVYGATVGSFLWNPNYGYFEINSIDVERGLIGIVNNCTEGNSSAGTQIPACTCFTVTDTPVDTSITSGICVTVDFTAPAEDMPLDITLTSTDGITASDTIQIGTGFYFVSAVKPNNIITIINQGEGIAPGTPVIAQDANGNPQYCLSVVSSNPCDREPISEGTLLACDADGVTSPLGTPCQAGYIPVATADCTVEMQPAITPPLCVHTTLILDIVSGDATYQITVTSTTGFAVDDILTISGLGDTRATITSIDSATEMSVTLDPTPGVTSPLAIGALVCTINCCEELASIVDGLNLQAANQVLATPIAAGTITTETTVSGNIANGGPFVNSSTNTLTYVATIEYVWTGQINQDPDAYGEAILTYIPQFATIVGATGTTAPPAPVTDVNINLGYSYINTLLADSDEFLWNYGESYTRQLIGTIPPGNELRVSGRAIFGVQSLNGGSAGVIGVNYANVGTRVTTLLITS